MVLQCRFFSTHHAHTACRRHRRWHSLFCFFSMRFLSLSLNQNGRSALLIAAEKGSVEMVTVLVAANADLDLVNKVSAWERQ